jgi:hypothetical protein
MKAQDTLMSVNEGQVQGFHKVGVLGIVGVYFRPTIPKIFFLPPPALFFLQGWAGVADMPLPGFQTLREPSKKLSRHP